MFDTILVSLDGSCEAEAILPAVENLQKLHPCKVILLRVGSYLDVDRAELEMRSQVDRMIDLPSEDYALLREVSELDMRRYLDRIADRFRQLGSTPIVEVSYAEPADEIIFFAKHYAADLIAMATHARAGLNRLLHRSVTERVLHHAPCPMLIVRVPEKSTEQLAETHTVA